MKYIESKRYIPAIFAGLFLMLLIVLGSCSSGIVNGFDDLKPILDPAFEIGIAVYLESGGCFPMEIKTVAIPIVNRINTLLESEATKNEIIIELLKLVNLYEDSPLMSIILKNCIMTPRESSNLKKCISDVLIVTLSV